MPRRSGEETKQLLLRTGMELLLTRGVSAGVSHIRLQEVVRKSGLTTGAAYRLWADQDDFHRDLAVAVARWRDNEPVAELRQLIGAPEMADAPLDELIRLAAAAHVRAISGESSRNSQVFLVALALRTSARTWAALTEAAVARHEESVTDFAHIYTILMQTHGYRMRAPLTVHDFTVAMAALGEGFAVQAVEGVPHPVFARAPGDLDEAGLGGSTWTLFGLATRALVHSFMVSELEQPSDATVGTPENSDVPTHAR